MSDGLSSDEIEMPLTNIALSRTMAETESTGWLLQLMMSCLSSFTFTFIVSPFCRWCYGWLTFLWIYSQRALNFFIKAVYDFILQFGLIYGCWRFLVSWTSNIFVRYIVKAPEPFRTSSVYSLMISTRALSLTSSVLVVSPISVINTGIVRL